MNCTNHPDMKAKRACSVCGRPFCKHCLVKHKGANLCIPDYVKIHREELAAGQRERERATLEASRQTVLPATSVGMAISMPQKAFPANQASPRGGGERAWSKYMRWWDFGILAGIGILAICAFSSTWAVRVATVLLAAGFCGGIGAKLLLDTKLSEGSKPLGEFLLRSFSCLGAVALALMIGINIANRPAWDKQEIVMAIGDAELPLADAQSVFAAEDDQGIQVKEQTNRVEVTLPSWLVEGTSAQELTARDQEDGIVDKQLHEDGSMTMVFDQKQYEQLLQKMAKDITERFQEILDQYQSIHEIHHSSDFREIILYVDESGYLTGQDSAASAKVGIQGALYQVLSGIRQNQVQVEVLVKDRETDKVIALGLYPSRAT